MKGLSDGIKDADKKISDLETKRESAIAMSRSIIRKTKIVIHAIHTNKDYTVTQEELVQEMEAMQSKLKGCYEILLSGPVLDAMMEFSESMILSAIIRKENVPSFDDLKIPAGPWLLGLADVVGELRRLTLTNVISDDMDKAEYYFQSMEDIGNEIMMLNVPDAIIPLRRKQDVVRGLIEKTRSDLANAVMFSKIKERK